jgi:tRNA (guanine-N7-)-methyltransferase
MPEPGEVEFEFGVPFAGVIAPPAQWTRTALKELPETGPVDWPAIFGRSAPIVLDVGCGNGRFVIASAVARPEVDHLGLDVLPLVVRYGTRRANQRGLANVRFAVGGGHEFLDRLAPPRSVAEIHLYHPQPQEQAHGQVRRLVSPEFLALVLRTLEPGGRFIVQTDNRAYWNYLVKLAPHFFDFRGHEGPWPDAPAGRTRREIIARRQRLPIFRGLGTPRGEVASPEKLAELCRELPPPAFDAGDGKPARAASKSGAGRRGDSRRPHSRFRRRRLR